MLCACAESETGRRLCMSVCVSKVKVERGEGVTVACWTIVSEQNVGQGLPLANLSWLQPRLGVLNFCMHDQWH